MRQDEPPESKLNPPPPAIVSGMENSPIIASLLFACLALALLGAGSLVKRHFGKRDLGIVGAMAMVPTTWVLMWLASHFVSKDSYCWYVVVFACAGISALVAQVLFGKPRQAVSEKPS